MPTQRECVCCREQPEEENKIQGRILRLYCISCSKWNTIFFVQYCAKVMQTIIDEYHEYRDISVIFNEILP